MSTCLCAIVVPLLVVLDKPVADRATAVVVRHVWNQASMRLRLITEPAQVVDIKHNQLWFEDQHTFIRADFGLRENFHGFCREEWKRILPVSAFSVCEN